MPKAAHKTGWRPFLASVSRSAKYPLLALALLLLFVTAISSIYGDVKQQAIADLNKRQAVHARQAVQGIRDFIQQMTHSLENLARLPEIAAPDDDGRRAMADFQRLHADEIRGITRVDKRGTIIHTVPDTGSSGRDISGQKHVREALDTRRTVVSDIFLAVQGFRTIAIHAPVYRDGAFDGTLAFLLSFDRIAQRYIENIRIGSGGYAWVISANGYELSCPVPGHTGRHVSETCRDFPDILAMTDDMLRGRSGTAVYHFDKIAGKTVRRTLKHAVYMPIPIGNTFWSVVVATPEDEALAPLSGLRTRLTLLAIALLGAGVLTTALVVRSRAIIRGQRERESILNALQESERKYRTLIETTHTGFVILDPQGRVVDANAEYVRLSGHRTLDEIIGRNVAEWLAPHEQERNRQAFARCMAEGSIRNLEIDHRDPAGVDTPIEINATVVELGGLPRILGLCRDIRSRRLATLANEKLQAELTQAHRVESIGRLAGGIAHDFNNMLSVIHGRAEMALEQAPAGTPLRDGLQEILKAAQRSGDLTRQLLTFARKQTIAPRLVGLNDAIETMLKMLHRLIGENIELVWKPGRDAGAVKIDPAQLDQVLANLAVNARDAISGVGRLTIETGRAEIGAAECAGRVDFLPGAYSMLKVGDDGCGMDEETRAHLFEPFYTTKAVGRGTGLGLAMVHGIVKQNGGFIDVRSAPGQGTTFTIYLPRQSDPTDPAEPRTETEPPTPRRGDATVLLVEDEPMVLELNQSMLQMLGYRVLPARSPAEALRLAQSHGERIHLLVTDVVMPEMNGRELARQLLAVQPRLACLFVSGYTASVISPHGVLEPGMHFLQKPFSVNELAAKVREALSDCSPCPPGSSPD